MSLRVHAMVLDFHLVMRVDEHARRELVEEAKSSAMAQHPEVGRVPSTSKTCAEDTEEPLKRDSQGKKPEGDQDGDDDAPMDRDEIRLPVRDSETVGDEGGGRP